MGASGSCIIAIKLLNCSPSIKSSFNLAYKASIRPKKVNLKRAHCRILLIFDVDFEGSLRIVIWNSQNGDWLQIWAYKRRCRCTALLVAFARLPRLGITISNMFKSEKWSVLCSVNLKVDPKDPQDNGLPVNFLSLKGPRITSDIWI